jgi:hypothetical protein
VLLLIAVAVGISGAGGIGLLRIARDKGGTPGVHVTARLNGQTMSGATTKHPVRVEPQSPASLSVDVTNDSARSVTVHTLRLQGKLLGVTFYELEATSDLVVPPGSTRNKVYNLDLHSLSGQATGLIPSTVDVLDDHQAVVASQTTLVDIRGSWRSLSGEFGIGVAVMTLMMVFRLILVAARRRHPSRLNRALAVPQLGLGLGLTTLFFLSTTRSGYPGTPWVPTVIGCVIATVAVTPWPRRRRPRPSPEPAAASPMQPAELLD